MNCCTGNCRQGRDCPNTDATLSALGFYHDDEDEPPWSLSDVEPGFWVAIVGGLLGLVYGLSELVRVLVAAWR